jgi:16S rRNA (guanine966-N2)-methyltransferase
MVDLFAGTGAIGIEAFSRGAHRVIFVEPNPASLQILRHNLQQCGNPSGMRVIPKSAWQIVQDPDFLKQGPFDIMFVDPSYQASGLEKLLFLIGEHGTISPTGILVVEHFSNTVIPRHLSSLSQVRQKQYGRTVLTFFEPSLPSLDANRCVPRNV